MASHLKVLGLLNILVGGFGALMGVIFFGLFAGPTIAGTYGPVIGYMITGTMALITLTALPCIAVGIGLFHHRPWARTLGTIIAIVELLNFPIGTVLGVYALTILMSSDVDEFFSPRFNQRM